MNKVVRVLCSHVEDLIGEPLYLCNVALARSRAHKGCAVGAEARGSNAVKMTDALAAL